MKWLLSGLKRKQRQKIREDVADGIRTYYFEVLEKAGRIFGAVPLRTE